MPAQTAPSGDRQSASISKLSEKIYSPTRRDAPSDPQPWWMWWLLFAVVAGILCCRQPQAIRHACYFGEDGKIFFKQQYEDGFSASLFTHYNKYLHFLPRIVAGICSFVPLEYNPTAYAVICLLVASAILTFFFASGFRSVIKSDLLRAIIVLTFTLMPNSESLMRLAYIGWYFVFFVSLLTVHEMPRKPLARWLLLVPAMLAAWSAPQAIVCLPLVLWRAWLAQERTERTWWALLACAMIGFAFTAEKGTAAVANMLQQQGWTHSVRHAIGFRVFCYFFLGEALSQNLPANGWSDVGRLSLLLLIFCGVITMLSTRRPRLKDWRTLVSVALFYLILASPALFALRWKMLADFQAYGAATWFGGGRYFFTATLLLCVLGGAGFERVILSRMTTNRAKAGTLLLFCFWLHLHSSRFALPEWETEHSWRSYAQQIRATERRVLQSGGTETVHIETSFKPFDFDLVVTPATAGRDSIGRPAN